MKNPDRLLERAGFIAAMGTPEVGERAGVHLKQILQEEKFLKLGDDAARTVYLRRRLGEEIGSDAKVRVAVCPTLRTYSVDLGLEVADCAVPGTKGP